MKFHPAKCKVLKCTLKTEIIPTVYSMNNIEIEISECERDLGVIMHRKLLYNKHHKGILGKASQKLGLVKRNCSIVDCYKSRKVLYLSLVRSLFEHCSPIWRPMKSTQVDKFEKIQKRAVKWIFNESYCRYSERGYFDKLKFLNILPMDDSFK